VYKVDPHLGLAKLGPKIYGEIGKTAVEHGNSLRPKQRRGFLVASLLGHHKAALNFGFKFAKPEPGKLKFLI